MGLAPLLSSFDSTSGQGQARQLATVNLQCVPRLRLSSADCHRERIGGIFYSILVGNQRRRRCPLLRPRATGDLRTEHGSQSCERIGLIARVEHEQAAPLVEMGRRHPTDHAGANTRPAWIDVGGGIRKFEDLDFGPVHQGGSAYHAEKRLVD
jgi:hypothetical protein